MKSLTYKDIISPLQGGAALRQLPPNCNFWVNAATFERILKELPAANYPYAKYDHHVGGIKMFIEEEIPDDEIFYCPRAVIDWYKKIKNHPWTSQEKVQYFKLAVIMYEQDINHGKPA